jgi:hypothetical protein
MKYVLFIALSLITFKSISQHQNELGVKTIYGYGISKGSDLRHTYIGIDLMSTLTSEVRAIYGFGYANKKYTVSDDFISNHYLNTSAMIEAGDIIRFGLGAYLNIKMDEKNSFGIDGFESETVNDFGFFTQYTYMSGKLQPFLNILYSPIQNEKISILAGLRYSLYRK